MSRLDGITVNIDADATEFNKAVEEAVKLLGVLEEAAKEFSALTNKSATDLFKPIVSHGTRKKITEDEKVKAPLLTIELEDETSVPKVFYKGKRLDGKAEVEFGWKTKNKERLSNSVTFDVRYFDKEAKSEKIIGTRSGGYLGL